MNDIADRFEDAQHPIKKLRPISSGAVTISQAKIIFWFCIIASVGCSIFLPQVFSYFILAYLALNMFYNFRLKHIAIVDALTIALGFLIRVYAGGCVGAIPISIWLAAITVCVSLLLAFGKRYEDLLLIQKTENNIRPSLDGYTLIMLRNLVKYGCIFIIGIYVAYTFSPETQHRIQQPLFFLTTIPVVFGLAIYYRSVIVKSKGGDPFELLFKNHLLQLSIAFWLAMTFWFLYH